MTEQQIKEFETLSEQLIKWLNDNCNPHSTIIITNTTAELLEGKTGLETFEYVKD